MQVIEWNPAADPMYQFGRTLGLAGKYLADSRDNRQAFRMKDAEAYDEGIGEQRQIQNKISGFLERLPNMTEQERDIAAANIRNYEGFAGFNQDNAGKYMQGLTERIHQMQNIQSANKSHYVHDDGYTPYHKFTSQNPFRLGGF